MKEIALNILDIANNSIRAGCKTLKVEIEESEKDNFMKLTITDDGCGMDEEVLKKVTDPFYSSRKTRHIGLGVPFLKQHAEMAGGTFDIKSKLGVGTVVTATFVLDHPDRQPLGDIESVMSMIISSNPEIDYYYLHKTDEAEAELDTKAVKEELGDIPITEPEVIKILKDMMSLE